MLRRKPAEPSPHRLSTTSGAPFTIMGPPPSLTLPSPMATTAEASSTQISGLPICRQRMRRGPSLLMRWSTLGPCSRRRRPASADASPSGSLASAVKASDGSSACHAAGMSPAFAVPIPRFRRTSSAAVSARPVSLEAPRGQRPAVRRRARIWRYARIARVTAVSGRTNPPIAALNGPSAACWLACRIR